MTIARWNLVALLLSIAGTAACKFAELPPIEEDAAVDHSVGGTIDGLWTGANLVLRLEPVGLPPQQLTVDREGSFTFPDRLPSNTPFAFAIESDADQHECQVESTQGEVRALDVMDLHVRCTSRLSITLGMSANVPFTFDPQASHQELDVSVIVGQVAVTVGGPVGTTVMVNGTSTALGVSSAPLMLAAGANTIAVDVSVAQFSRRYEIVLNRGAIQATEYSFAKASYRDADDNFGFALAAWGDFVAIAAPFEDSNNPNNRSDNSATDSGAIYMFRRNGTELDFLKAPSAHNLGFSLAMNDQWLVAGAPDDSGTTPGSVQAWRRSGMSWPVSQTLTASNASNGDGYGYSVDVYGDTLAVGAYLESNGSTTNQGAVYIYRLDGGWIEETIIRAPDAASGDLFGSAVSLGQDIIAIGAVAEGSGATGVSTSPATDENTRPSGAVYVFRRTGTTWALEAYIKASNTGMYDNFGQAVDLDGDVLAVGAPGEASSGADQSDNSTQLSGAVYVFRRSGTTWTQEAFVKTPSPQRDDQFGVSVSVRGDTLAVGAKEFFIRNDPGSVYLFNHAGGTWGPTARLAASNADPGDRFCSFALSADGLYVGAHRESSQTSASDNNLTASGAAYFFH